MPTSIEWADETWNPVVGCTRVSRGCDNCYAVKMTKRLEAMGQEKYAGLVNVGKGHFNGVVKCHEDALSIPFHWKKPRRVFVNSMSDLFHEKVPFSFVDKCFAVMALCPSHTFLILTKRPERMAEYFAERVKCSESESGFHDRGDFIVQSMRLLAESDKDAFKAMPKEDGFLAWPLPNVWIGTSVEDQEAADERIPHLIEVPASIRFLSCEPLLSGLDLSRWLPIEADRDSCLDGVPSPIQWVIAGGESGPGCRPCELSWIESLLRQCRVAKVPVFIKQLGGYILDDGDRMRLPHKGGDWSSWETYLDHLKVREYPDA